MKQTITSIVVAISVFGDTSTVEADSVSAKGDI